MPRGGKIVLLELWTRAVTSSPRARAASRSSLALIALIASAAEATSCSCCISSFGGSCSSEGRTDTLATPPAEVAAAVAVDDAAAPVDVSLAAGTAADVVLQDCFSGKRAHPCNRNASEQEVCFCPTKRC